MACKTNEIHFSRPVILIRGLTFLAALVTGVVMMTSDGRAQKQGRADVAPAEGVENSEVQRLRQRVEQLEEQLVDLQVTIGTIESLSRKGGGGASLPSNNGATGGGFGPQFQGPVSGGSGSSARLQSMETQIGALTRQVEQLTRRLNGGGGSLAGAQQGWDAGGQRQPQNDYGFRNGAAPQQGPSAGGFGDVTVTPDSQVQPQSNLNSEPQGSVGDLNAQQANFAGRPPREIYDEAYKHLLVQNYGAAQSAFTNFLRQYPSDNLAGNAQYWLGESYYVRGQYKDAAGAFLKGYTVYAKSQKAPDSLLKLAMSLKRLGQKDAACETFSELNTRFPGAPSHIKQRAQSERRRSGC